MKIELIEKIEQFLNNEITRDNLERYSKEHEVVGLDEKITWVKNTAIAIEQDGLRDQVTTLFKSETNKKTGKIISLSRMKWSIGIAASMLILITGYWMNFGSNQSSYSKYDFTDPGLPVVMGQSNDYDLYDALSYYSEENYSMTIEKLSKILEGGQSSDTIMYYLGASQSYKGNYQKSIKYLEKVLIDPNSTFVERAEWLTISNLLNLKEFEKVNLRLAAILENENHEFFELAQQLKDELQQ